MLLAEKSRLEAELALTHQKVAKREVQMAKMDHSLNLANMELIGCIEKLMKQGKLQSLPPNLIDGLLKWMEEREMATLTWKMESQLWLQQKQSFDKKFGQNTKKVTGAIKPVEENVEKLEPQEEQMLFSAPTDKAVEQVAPAKQQVRLAEKKQLNVKRKSLARLHSKQI